MRCALASEKAVRFGWGLLARQARRSGDEARGASAAEGRRQQCTADIKALMMRCSPGTAESGSGVRVE